MMRLRTLVLATLSFWILAVAGARAQEPIRFARTPDISPDGKLIAFSYLGDIWVVEAIGGVAKPITMHERHDVTPVFSPDGTKIAFASNRHGNYDVFVVPAQGGKPTRLTFDSADDYPTGWSPDGKHVLFASKRSPDFPPRYELYCVAATGGKVRRISAFEGREGVFSPKGDQIAYVRGPGTWYRKGYRGSSNDDIWLSSADGSNNRQLTKFDGQDTSPMWAADGQSIYYVSECCGTKGAPANIVRQALTGSAKPEPITKHKEESVRQARISGNGQWIVYECGPDLWIVSAKGGPSRKLAIEVHADDKVNPERKVTFTSGASEFAVSQDEKYIAFVVHGEIFLMPRGGGKAKRLTETAAYNHGIAWSPDSRKIVFVSDKDGQEDLYSLESDDPDTSLLIKAHKFKIKRLTNTHEAESTVQFAPDGKRIAFIRAGKLVTMKPDGSDEKVVVKEGTVIDLEWSPNSKWLAYARVDGSYASEIYIIPAGGATKEDPARNVSRYATFNYNITWSKTGHKLAFISERKQNMPSMVVMSLQKPAAPGAPLSNDIDWEDIHLRVQQPLSTTAVEGAISNQGDRVAFRAAQGGDDLWVASADGRSLTRVTTGNLRPSQIQWSHILSDLIYFRDGNGQLRMTRVTLTGDPNPPVVPFQAKMTIRRSDEFKEMFDQSWRALRDNFYDEKFHGVDWNAIRDKYRPLVKHVAMKEDLYYLIYLMLGELNASHLGIGGPSSPPEEMTAELGLIYDESYKGPGMRIAEILKGGPADKRGINLKAGDIILAIDRVKLTDAIDISKLLNDKVDFRSLLGEMVELEVYTPTKPGALPPPDAKGRKVEVQAAHRRFVAHLMYERWVAHNAKKVSDLSKGKLGYIHIPSMDEPGLEQFVRSLYSDNFDKDAIVLDVRFNGGGFTHDRVLNYLGGKDHTFFQMRYGGQGPVMRAWDRKWTKPLVLLINNRSYSDAEIFPSAFRTLGLGKLVGQPTGAHVIGTMSVRLIDGSEFRLPRTGVYTIKGVNMEKVGVTPDVVVDVHPDQLAKGEDPQLVKAVEVLQQDVIAWKKKHSEVAFNPGGPVTPPGPGVGATPGPKPNPMTGDPKK
jgi:tricorn protease